jgi:hypothetical protein
MVDVPSGFFISPCSKNAAGDPNHSAWQIFGAFYDSGSQWKQF